MAEPLAAARAGPRSPSHFRQSTTVQPASSVESLELEVAELLAPDLGDHGEAARHNRGLRRFRDPLLTQRHTWASEGDDSVSLDFTRKIFILIA